MPVTINFRGLCAFVADTEGIQGSSSLDVVLVDAAGAGVPHVHTEFLRFRESDLTASPPAGLVQPDPVAGWLRVPLRRRRVKIAGSSAEAITVENVESLASLKLACGLGVIDADCLAETPAVRPVACRIELPMGTLKCDVDPPQFEWSFHPTPPDLQCYSGRFSKEVQYRFDAPDGVKIQVRHFGGSNSTLQLGSASRIQVKNISEPPLGKVRFFPLYRLDPAKRRAFEDLPLADDPPHHFALYRLLHQDPEHKPYVLPMDLCDLDTIRDSDDGDSGCLPVRLTR